jgi:hypothetical protein
MEARAETGFAVRTERVRETEEGVPLVGVDARGGRPDDGVEARAAGPRAGDAVGDDVVDGSRPAAPRGFFAAAADIVNLIMMR